MEKLKYTIQEGQGPSLHELLHSLGRRAHEENPVYDVTFWWRDNSSCLHQVDVSIQGMERPMRTNFWKIRASCLDLTHKYTGEINVIALYDPQKRIGYVDFTHPQKSLLPTK